MKRLLLAMAFLCAIVLQSAAQKVDLDKFNFTFDYRDLPTAPLNPEYRTYSVNLDAPAAVRNNYGEGSLEDMVVIDGWKRVTGTKGHVIFTVRLGDINISSSQLSERVDIQKDKDGKETGRKYYYKMDVSYTWSASAVAKDYKDAAITSYELGSSISSSWSSSEYPTRKEANDYYYNNRDNIKSNLLSAKIKEGMAGLNSFFSSKYGFSPRKEYEILWILDSKKHPEYAAQHDAWDKFKATISKATADQMPDETVATLKELIGYFDGIPAKFAADEKADKKMRYAAFYNKGKIYLYLDNPEAAIKEADALIANGYDEGDGKRIKKEAEALAELLKKNNATSRHFAIDTNSFAPPAVN